MALFIFWHDAAQGRAMEQVHDLLEAEAHIVPEAAARLRIESPAGPWHLAAFATTTHFYRPDDQIWSEPGQGACVVHGLIWRYEAGRPRVLNARDVAALLDRPGAAFPADVAGEYSVARLHADGTLSAFTDRAGLHQLFHAALDKPVVANRAGLIATLLDDWRSDPATLGWLTAVGYRIGRATAYRAVTQLGQEQRLTVTRQAVSIALMAAPLVRFDPPRGFSPALDAQLDEGIAQAQAAILLGADADGSITMPITGGKDSRAMLAIALAAGLGPRLRLFTRGYPGHPDVIAGAGVAAALGIPHRREQPHGSDEPAHWTRERFFRKLMTQAYQSDGMIGGWDLILGDRIAAETLISGHLGTVLKAYSRQPLSHERLDPLTMVGLQGPFDPMGILRPETRARFEGELAGQMDRARAEGACEADLPDIYYYRNRLPNWVGGIRVGREFERQTIEPLGVPALLGLAFRLTAEERKHALIHFKIMERCAPALLAMPFAHQRWDRELEGAPQVDPILPGPDAPPLFGNWQYSLNHNPAIRAALAAHVVAHPDLTLWSSVDRDALLDRLRNRRIDYFGGISLLGLTIGLFQESAAIQVTKIGAGDSTSPARPVASLVPFEMHERPELHGHVDAVRTEGESVFVDGWVFAENWPAAQPALEARAGGQLLGTTVAADNRPDLVPHGKGDGRHGFSLEIPRARLRAVTGEAMEVEVRIVPFDSDIAIFTVRLTP